MPPNLEGSEEPTATREMLTSVTEVFSSGRGEEGHKHEQKVNK